MPNTYFINILITLIFYLICRFVNKINTVEKENREWYIKKQLKYEEDKSFKFYLYIMLLIIIFLIGTLGSLYLFVCFVKNFEKIYNTLFEVFELPFGLNSDYKFSFVIVIIMCAFFTYRSGKDRI